MSASLLQRLKYSTKSACAQGLYASGLLQLWTRVALRHNAVVLTYHRVLPKDALTRTWSHPGMIVSQETFERHMKLVKRLFNVLALPEFVAHVEAGMAFPRPSCLVTFDDGWLDTYGHAWPVLQRHGVPAVVFLPVEFIGSPQTFWQERLGHLLFQVEQRMRQDFDFHTRCLAVLDADVRSALEGDPDGLRDRVHAFVSAQKARDLTEPVALIDRLRTLVGDHDEPSVDVVMGWDQARLMARDGVTFGGHGATHRILTTLPLETVRSEVDAAKTVLERELNAPATAFSYPNGNWDQSIADEVRRSGFSVAFTTTHGRVSGSNRYAIRRVNMHEGATGSEPMLLARMVGLF